MIEPTVCNSMGKKRTSTRTENSSKNRLALRITGHERKSMSSEKTSMSALVHAVVTRQERGWAGHLIGADRCKFRRNTLLTKGEVRVVVSSLGLMTHWKGPDYGFEQVGSDRFFETMVFHAKYDGRYWDADTQRGLSFDAPWRVDVVDANDIANDQHEAVVDEIMQRMQSGEFDG